jgi:hypothetical protein
VDNDHGAQDARDGAELLRRAGGRAFHHAGSNGVPGLGRPSAGGAAHVRPGLLAARMLADYESRIYARWRSLRDDRRVPSQDHALAPLWLAELLVGLSLVADVDMGQQPGTSARAGFIAARLVDSLDAENASAVYYTTLLQHVGCTAFAHEGAALLGGDEIAVKAAAVGTDFGDPRDVLVRFLARLAPAAPPLDRVRGRRALARHPRRLYERQLRGRGAHGAAPRPGRGR